MERFLKAMIEEIKRIGVKDKNVLGALGKVKRHLFIPKILEKEAYLNIPLPLTKEQTISQPYTVAFMLEALEVKKGNKILEIGTGSGWNAALLSELTREGEVYSVEIIPELVEFARDNLKDYKNVKVILGDGSKGYSKEAPYDRIIVTAGAPEIPKELLKQLKDNGVLVAPVGPIYGQSMLKVRKIGKEIKVENLGDFVFVKLRGEYGWR